MTAGLIHGDQVSCSRIGGTMRRESSRLRQQAELLADALADVGDLADLADRGALADVGDRADVRRWDLPDVASTVRALRSAADDLDDAGAALQRYATELAEAHELGRRAERRVHEAGLLLEGTRVVEPWGPASAREAERRRAQVPEIQSRIDLATALIGRARGRLEREMARLTQCFAAQSHLTHPAGQTSPPSRES